MQKELENNKFCTVYMDVEELLDLGSLNYLDVLVAIARQLQEELAKRDLPLPDVLLNNIASWFDECIVEETKSTEKQGCVGTEAKAGSKIPFFAELFASVTANIKTGSTQRETIRKKLSRELSVFMDKLNLLISTAREKVRKKGFADLVLIVDGMEKMHYELNSEGQSNYNVLFIHNAERLRAPECHIIYTVPVSLAYQQNLKAYFDDIIVLPMVKTDKPGIKKLIEVVERRVDTSLVFGGPKLLTKLAQTSGGVVRDLMHLIRMSMETKAEQIGAADVDRAISNLRKIYDRLIRENDIEHFQRIQRTRRIQGGDEKAGRLLDQRLVLEYQNGDLWADIHPIVRQIPWVKAALADHAA
ncbi:hypothetical protein [Candidatus Electronema sp. PJ]|uniref:hypothetical protein n=1 Tax=Candidatus Electronema sp. PJ TaxID=3401572 RepID=UPI003AA85E03